MFRFPAFRQSIQWSLLFATNIGLAFVMFSKKKQFFQALVIDNRFWVSFSFITTRDLTHDYDQGM